MYMISATGRPPHDSRTQRGADDEGLGHRHVDYTALTEALKKTS
jgi:hypothetical protein